MSKKVILRLNWGMKFLCLRLTSLSLSEVLSIKDCVYENLLRRHLWHLQHLNYQPNLYFLTSVFPWSTLVLFLTRPKRKLVTKKELTNLLFMKLNRWLRSKKKVFTTVISGFLNKKNRFSLIKERTNDDRRRGHTTSNQRCTIRRSKRDLNL